MAKYDIIVNAKEYFAADVDSSEYVEKNNIDKVNIILDMDNKTLVYNFNPKTQDWQEDDYFGSIETLMQMILSHDANIWNMKITEIVG